MLAALFMKPRPPALALLVVVLDAHIGLQVGAFTNNLTVTPDEAPVDVERGQDSNSHEADVAVERIDQKSQEQTNENARL